MNKDKLYVVQQFLERCRGHIIKVDERRKYESDYFNKDWTRDTAYHAFIQEQKVSVANVELELELFANELVDYYEIRELLRDPETRQLINEARFINRLKRGRYGP
jgi:hypothetical protein